MRAVLIAVLAGLLVVLLVRAVVLHRDHRWSIAVVVAVLVVLVGFEWRWTASVHQLSRAARTVAPAAEGVTCQRLSGTFGRVGADAGHVDAAADGSMERSAFLTYETCAALFSYLRSDKASPSIEQTTAVHVLTHESVHLTGQGNEALTECEAMQRDEAVARALGATVPQARALAETYAVAVYPQLDSRYRTPDCRSGGPLDGSPGDGRWP
jgi:hypothetical protein